MANSLSVAEGGRSPRAGLSDPHGELAESYAYGVVDLAMPLLPKRMQNVLYVGLLPPQMW